MIAPKPVTAKQIKKLTVAYESAFTAIMGTTNSMIAESYGVQLALTYLVRDDALVLFRRLHELHDALDKQERDDALALFRRLHELHDALDKQERAR